MTTRESIRMYWPAALLALTTAYAAAKGSAAALGLGVMTIGYAVPFTRRQFHATGRTGLRLAFTSFVVKMLGLALFVAALASSPTGWRFWMILGVVLAIFLPVWLWGARVMGNETALGRRPHWRRSKEGAR